MPFTMMGTHKEKSGHSYTYLDHITFELYDDNGDEYLIWLSLDNSADTTGRKWILRDSSISTDYFANNQPFNANEISDNTEIQIGNIFKITYTASMREFDLEIGNGEHVKITLFSSQNTQGLTIDVVQANRVFTLSLYTLHIMRLNSSVYFLLFRIQMLHMWFIW